MAFELANVAHIAVLMIMLPCFVRTTCPNIISRQEWNAAAPSSSKSLRENPPSYVVVHHSVTRMCNTTEDCKLLMKSIQNTHMNTNGWEDIGYNFLIGNDGNIYEGRGWGIHGAHAISYNARSLGICLIGNFEEYPPSESQLQALRELIACSLEENKLIEDYNLIGHNQESATLCPGKYLYNEIKTWSHFNNNPK
ncbi:hypothetical protein NQ315_005776 [Exocentrus adspersus]|uniref:Peptidoglycan-recognition protein n=1 Tax=Exocentrus adspersus TaxID=1586481 RepID=A0AAV8VQM9_9CUCU|nr:hypothetical protein NQ315_005776 [Exocentrus adspersus]